MPAAAALPSAVAVLGAGAEFPGGDPREHLDRLQARYDQAHKDVEAGKLASADMDTSWGAADGSAFESMAPSPFRG